MPDRPRQADRPLRIVAVTRAGSAIALRLLAALPNATAHVPDRFLPAARDPRVHSSASVVTAIREGFDRGEDVIAVAALGIVVRAVAPLLRDKRQDPAIVVVDDAGRFAISVLSGHLGGANALAARVAALIGAQPVITTAGEARAMTPIDLIGETEGWHLRASPAALRVVAAAAVNGDPVGVFQSAGSRRWRSHLGQVATRDFPDLAGLADSGLPGIVITERTPPSTGPIGEAGRERWVIYHPPILVAGIGCSRGATAGAIADLLDKTLQTQGFPREAVGRVATIDLKVDEAGLLQFAACRRLPIVYYTAGELARAGGPTPSEAVQAAVGTPGVCEPAARLAAAGGPLLVPKQKSREVTVAIARLLDAEGEADE